MQGLQKVKNTYYINKMIDGTRIRKSLGTDYQRAKIQALNLINEAQLDQEKYADIKNSGNTCSVNECINAFMNCEYGVYDMSEIVLPQRKRSWSKNQSLVVTYLVHMRNQMNVKYMAEINYEGLNKYMTHYRISHKPAAFNKRLTITKKFFKFCYEEDYITKDPSKKIKKERLYQDPRSSFTLDEAALVIENAGIMKSYFTVLLLTGIRKCDVRSLTKKQFEHDGDGWVVKLIENKTGTLLYVPVDDRVGEIVEESETEELFPEAIKNKRAWDEAALRIIRANFEWTEWKDRNINIHTFRHTFAMQNLANGTSMEVLKQLLGHQSVKTTEIYAHSMPKSSIRREMHTLNF